MAQAFLDSIDLVRTDAEVSRIVKALEVNDVDAALTAFHLDATAFGEFNEKIRESFRAAGVAAAASMPKVDGYGNKFQVRFDMRDLATEDLLRRESSDAITEIDDTVREGIRQALADGLARGDNPTDTALDIVGRINKETGRREGGMLGLHSRQVEYVKNDRAELLEGRYSDYMQRKTRDRRLDRFIRAARKSGKPIRKSDIDLMLGRMSDRLLKLRGDTIGRTETLGILHMGQYQAFEQAIATGKVTPDEIEREWQDVGDDRVRESHVEMDGQKIGWGEKYKTPRGAFLKYPGDPDGPAEEIINCRCNEAIRINFLKRIKSR
jgi:hypothetical protein